MRDRCASSPEAPESILCLIAWTIRLMLRSPLLSMTCIWSFSCSVASGDALHERGFRMLPKHELLLAICELLIFLLFSLTYLPFCIRSVLARKSAAFRLTASAISSANISTPCLLGSGCSPLLWRRDYPRRAADDTVGRINIACRVSRPCRALFIRPCDAAVPHVQHFYKYLSPAIFHRLRWGDWWELFPGHANGQADAGI